MTNNLVHYRVQSYESSRKFSLVQNEPTPGLKATCAENRWSFSFEALKDVHTLWKLAWNTSRNYLKCLEIKVRLKVNLHKSHAEEPTVFWSIIAYLRVFFPALNATHLFGSGWLSKKMLNLKLFSETLLPLFCLIAILSLLFVHFGLMLNGWVTNSVSLDLLHLSGNFLLPCRSLLVSVFLKICCLARSLRASLKSLTSPSFETFFQ